MATTNEFTIFCVRHLDRSAITTVAQIPVCADCDASYQSEARSLADVSVIATRPVFRSIIDAARQQNAGKAMEYSYYGY